MAVPEAKLPSVETKRPRRGAPPVFLVFSVGASGELRPVWLPDLPEAIRLPHARESTPSPRRPDVARTLELTRRLAAARRIWRLTPRHLEVLHALVLGQSNREIAARLGCRPKTVEAHVTALLERTDAPSRLAVVSAFWLDLTTE